MISKTAHAVTLGCKVNQYETRSIMEAWQGLGYETVDDPAAASVILVNSCAVTNKALADTRQNIRKLHRANPGAGIIVTGCAAQVFARELGEIEGVARVVPQEDKTSLLNGPEGSEPVLRGRWPGFAISGFDRSRPVVKVHDGCSHGCTYCIVPITRGRSVSRPVADVLEEVHRLFDAGFRELVISGINLRHYGRDLEGKPDFWDLMESVVRDVSPKWRGRARFRISSLEPGQLTDRALEVLASSPMICPHLHLSLQSGDKEVLRMMGRGHYDPRSVFGFLDKLSKYWPVMALGADILHSFPGETPELFNNTAAYVRDLPLTYAHVFPYSPRPGTRAADMPGQNDSGVKVHRAKVLRDMVDEKKKRFDAIVARQPRLDVVLRDLAPARGLCQFYVGCEFEAEGEGYRPGALIKARPVGRGGGRIVVEPLEDGA